MLNSQSKKPYKIVLLGDSGVGKTAIIQRFTSNKFEQKDNPTVGIDFIAKNFTRHNMSYRLQLWDTAGQQRFRSLIPSYMKDSSCAIFVYDLTDQESVEHLEIWIKIFKESKQGDSLMIVCGNKLDLGKQVYNQKLLESIINHNGMKHFKVSALSSQNVKQMFNNIVETLSEEQQRRQNRKMEKKRLDAQNLNAKKQRRGEIYESDIRLKSMTNLTDHQLQMESDDTDGAKKLKGEGLNSQASEEYRPAAHDKCKC